MMPRTHVLSAEPDSVSPDGSAEIRHILQSPHGDLTHAVCRAGSMAAVHHLPELDEGYFVLAGEGELWRRTEDREAVTSLKPGRWVAMPAGMKFTYRANKGTPLVFLVMVLPSWKPELFHTFPGGPWAGDADGTTPPTAESVLVENWMCGDLRAHYDYLAPDGSEIRLLADFAKGGLAQCTLPPGTRSSPVRHKTVHEIWYVTEGHGELWRRSDSDEVNVTILWPGVGVDIPLGTTFQFRTIGMRPLVMVLLTMPRWPGADEAVAEPRGRWG